MTKAEDLAIGRLQESGCRCRYHSVSLTPNNWDFGMVRSGVLQSKKQIEKSN